MRMIEALSDGPHRAHDGLLGIAGYKFQNFLAPGLQNKSKLEGASQFIFELQARRTCKRHMKVTRWCCGAACLYLCHQDRESCFGAAVPQDLHSF